MSSASASSFTSSFPIFASLISFSYFVELSNAFRTVLNGNSQAGHPSSALRVSEGETFCVMLLSTASCQCSVASHCLVGKFPRHHRLMLEFVTHFSCVC